MSNEREPNLSIRQWGWSLSDEFEEEDTPLNNFQPIKSSGGNKNKKPRREKVNNRPKVNKRKVFQKEEREYENERE